MIERILSLFFLFGSIFYLSEAQQLTFGTIGSPKSGFLPLIASIIAVLLALTLIINQLGRKKHIKQDKVDWTKFLFVTIGLLFYILVLNIIGYFSATFIFLFYLFKVADTEGWTLPLTIATGGSTIFFLTFRYLAVTLP